jgi:signal transduction histidine kinase
MAEETEEVAAKLDSRLYDELSRLNNELVTTQRELAKKNAELARLNEQKNRFLGIAAHDLRNPLEVILTYSQFLIEDAAALLPGEQVEMIHTVRSSSRFMLDLVENLLDISRIEAGRLDLDPAPLALGALVEHNTALNRVLAERRGIHLVLEQHGELPRMELDATKIEQVLNNLIGNAVKFSPPESTVTVRLSAEEERALLAVQDQGPGIAAGEMERLFRPFEKARVHGAESAKGAGLGLAIVKRIVQGHGGEIWVGSVPGQGSTFFVALPFRRPGGVG